MLTRHIDAEGLLRVGDIISVVPIRLEEIRQPIIGRRESLDLGNMLGNAIGVNYMMMAGHVVCAWLMARAALAAQARIDAGASDDYYRKKINTAIFFAEHILPRSEGLATMIRAGKASIMSIGAEDF